MTTTTRIKTNTRLKEFAEEPNMSTEELRARVAQKRDDFSKLRLPTLMMDGESVRVRTHKWVELPGKNVFQIGCSHNRYSKTMTVLNMRFDKGGKILPHKRVRAVRLFMIEGTCYDPVNDRHFVEGDTFRYPAGTEFSLESDGALMTLTFTPPLAMELLRDDEVTEEDKISFSRDNSYC